MRVVGIVAATVMRVALAAAPGCVDRNEILMRRRGPGAVGRKSGVSPDYFRFVVCPWIAFRRQ
jgi:hypothetical protein